MKRSILFLSFFLFNCFVFSSDFTAFLRFSGALSNDALFSREIEVENFHVSKKFPFKCSLSISQESFHNVLWGPTNRFGMKCNLLFGEKNDLFLKT
ncbi:MAG TPA: hypothetical protein PLF61_06735, partial [Candidatus Goldiibacteriota bacterium]|nr:hypothetical protein [Candidatus Goldiibacteriota bacterium]